MGDAIKVNSEARVARSCSTLQARAPGLSAMALFTFRSSFYAPVRQ